MVSKFNIGDIVKLNSDGPKMTITKFNSADDLYTCEYFWYEKCHYNTFPGAALKKVSPRKRGE